MKQTLLLFIAFLSVTVVKAQDFIQDGIGYNIIEDASTEVAVASKGELYEGDLIIPSTIVYGGVTFTVTGIGHHSLSGSSSVTSISIPESVNFIGSQAFENCSGLTAIAIPSNVTIIHPSAFENCSGLTSINIPIGVITLGYDMFRNCISLETVTIPESVESIGNGAFEGCTGLTSINLPGGLTSISSSVFKNCENLISVNIPIGITSIKSSTFSGCTSLGSITISGNISSIDFWAFRNCVSLTSVTTYIETPLTIGEDVFEGVDISQIPLFVPAGTEVDYEVAAVWQDFLSITASADMFDESLNIIVYPNPVLDVLNVESNVTTEVLGVAIFDIEGKQVMTSNNSCVNVSGLQKGLYILQIETEKGTITKKFIKE